MKCPKCKAELEIFEEYDYTNMNGSAVYQPPKKKLRIVRE